jgi:hypothetical protein
MFFQKMLKREEGGYRGFVTVEEFSTVDSDHPSVKEVAL